MGKEVSCEKEKPEEQPLPFPMTLNPPEQRDANPAGKVKRKQKPKSSGNKNFRKLNKMGFYRFIRKKEQERERNK